MTSSGRGASTSRRVDWRPLLTALSLLAVCPVLAALVLAAPISSLQHGHGDHHHAPANGRFSKPSEHISPLGTKSQSPRSTARAATRPADWPPVASDARTSYSKDIHLTYNRTLLYSALVLVDALCVCTRTCCRCVCLLTRALAASFSLPQARPEAARCALPRAEGLHRLLHSARQLGLAKHQRTEPRVQGQLGERESFEWPGALFRMRACHRVAPGQCF